MNKPSKCKNCQWYGKPYWSIINPCDNCPMENVEILTRWIDPSIEEKDKEIEEIKEKWNKDKQFIECRTKEWLEYKERINKAIDKLYCYGEVFDREILKQFQKEMLDILQGSDKNDKD